MEPRYIIIMDFSIGELIKIKLTDEQLKCSEEYEDFGEFLSSLEEEYDFQIERLPLYDLSFLIRKGL